MEDEPQITVKSLLSAFDSKTILEVKKINFKGIDIKDAYNITAPFTVAGKTYIAARVESRESELDSKILFFTMRGGMWMLDDDAPTFNLQDPSVIIFKDKIILSGVKIFQGHSQAIQYKTVFLEGTSIQDLKEISEGPVNMKDIRIINLENERIGIFTRPQGSIGGRGRIGFIEVPSFNDFKSLSAEEYYRAPIIINNLSKNEWIGTNAVYKLSNGLIGVLGHIACFSDSLEKNYYPVVFAFSPIKNKVYQMKIIARRKDLPSGQSKRDDLKNVIFPGGLIRKPNKTAVLYVGAGDAESYEVTIDDPFLSYENISM